MKQKKENIFAVGGLAKEKPLWDNNNNVAHKKEKNKKKQIFGWGVVKISDEDFDAYVKQCVKKFNWGEFSHIVSSRKTKKK